MNVQSTNEYTETRLAYIKVVCQRLRSVLEAPRYPEGVLPLQNLHLLAHSLAERGALVGPTMEGDPVREDVEGGGVYGKGCYNTRLEPRFRWWFGFLSVDIRY